MRPLQEQGGGLAPGTYPALAGGHSAGSGKNENKDNDMNTRDNILHKLKTVSGTDTAAGLPEPFTFNRHQPCVDLFKTMAVRNGILVHETQCLEQLPALMAEQYPEFFGAQKICISPCLSGLPWHTTDGQCVFNANDGKALTGISRANAAVAQTGALVFINCEDNPAANHFLPEQHIIVVKESDIKDTMSDVLSPSCKTNAVNLVAGPSSTADIAGRILVGVHGPARVICYIAKI